MNVEMWTLGEAAELLGETANLIGYLVNDRQIPCWVVGRSKVLNAEGMELLKQALADYRSKTGKPKARKRRTKRRRKAA